MKTETRQALKHDAFIEQTQSGIGWAAANLRQVVTAAIAAAVLIGLVLALAAWQQRRSAQASEALGAAMAIYTAPLAEPGAPPLPGAYTNANARASAAHAKFEEVAGRYGSTEIGKSSRYFAGLTAAEMGDTRTAEAELKTVAGSADRNLANLAKMALAGLYQSSKRDAQAIDLYNQLIAKSSETVPVTMAQLQLAGLYEATAPDKARALYARIKDEDKTGPAGQLAAKKLGVPSAR